MNAARRIASVVHADALIRLRRTSTLVIFLLLSWLAWVWVPEPSSGFALMQIGGARVLYNSAAIAMGTASLATIFIGLVGYYVVSNALKRDLQTRAGFIVASTTVRNLEYIFAKFLGNLAFLTIFTFGYMLVSMAMIFVRGEAALEPLVFVQHYLFLAAPALVMTSALAITFESVPFLSGRFGDVAYFFVWIGLLSIAAGSIAGEGASALAMVDMTGFAVMSAQMKEIYNLDSFGIGRMAYEAGTPPFTFNGLRFGAADVFSRIIAATVPLLLIPVAAFFFRRFDPAKVKASAARQGRHPIAWLNRRLKGLAAPLARVPLGTSFPSQVANDALLTFQLAPLGIVAGVGFAIAAMAIGDVEGLRSGLLPVAFVFIAAMIADGSSRDAHMLALLFSTPGARARYTILKVSSAILVTMMILAGPLTRLALENGRAALALLAGAAFVSSAATLLGIVTRNPKAFLVLFLLYWYVTVNDQGATAALDFGGFFGEAVPTHAAAFAGVAALMAAAAWGAWKARLAREW